jgi:hypothetical protein
MVNKFGLAEVCWTIGRTKNFVCFQEKKLNILLRSSSQVKHDATVLESVISSASSVGGRRQQSSEGMGRKYNFMLL